MLIERAISLLIKTVSSLPPRFAYRMAKILYVLASLLSIRMYRTSLINLRLCFPNVDQEHRNKLLRNSMTHSFFLAFEFAYMVNWSREKLLSHSLEIEGQAFLDKAISKKQGVLILVPHFGNFEFMEVFLGSYYDFAALYTEPKIKAFNKVLSDMRERHGGKMFPTNSSGLRSIVNKLKQGGVTAILPDQVPGKNFGAIESSFFGNPIRYMSLVHRLILKNNPEVLIASVKRVIEDNKFGYHIVIDEAPSSLYSSEPEIHAKALGEIVEKVIMRSPEQYQWEYKIFKDPSLDVPPEQDVYRRQ